MADKPKVVALKRKPKPDAELVAECRRLLDLAEAGELATLAHVAEYTDDREPALYVGGDYDTYRTCGLLDALKVLAMEDDA
ncbi:hypothetical protein MBSD_n2122 [Mizugakiibacter sediminis]|uniref:Uncharacterized protein n=1 Tax=Mizugakiibacter sediminis TaxID=1475481 RepID=A0A0K8QR04_9GAMM|nr:hypothetical protein [Mizugakiibacter sediminis]GAP66807.1 hypothetical protein MBSD_n2122 [Mizugakiibacter sediminis]